MIQIGDSLTLELKNAEQVEKLKCRIVDRKDNLLYIDYPINLRTNKTAFLFDGTQLNATFIDQDGTSVYLFKSEIVGRVKINIPMLVLTYPGSDGLIKIQRRNYVRIEAAVDVAIHPLGNEFEPFTAVTDDISAGGAAVLIPHEITLQPDMMVKTWIVLLLQNGEFHYLSLRSRIVRVIRYNETMNKLSLQFNDISNMERQLLLRFCFERQLEIKKKGLLT
ncbi:flagellar brake protein [Neobacillus sp. SM06]|uniref:flagellar brake protein n=1 Tax=Neobacillus sp. SM06 TaxID=3422492 RepID=UPI003D27E0CE